MIGTHSPPGGGKSCFIDIYTRLPTLSDPELNFFILLAIEYDNTVEKKEARVPDLISYANRLSPIVLKPNYTPMMDSPWTQLKKYIKESIGVAISFNSGFDCLSMENEYNSIEFCGWRMICRSISYLSLYFFPTASGCANYLGPPS